MKRIIYTLFIAACIGQVHAQVGIGTETPDNSAMLDVESSERGILFPRMTSAQRAAITAPATGLHVFDTNSNSLWYFNGTVWVNTAAEASLGDVKSGFQPNDHSGWVKLDGRAVNTLNANQQAAAIALGFTTNLPDASSAYLVQNGSGMGAVSGANTTTLIQANLPNVTFTGEAASAGAHNHTVDPAPVNTNSTGDHSHSGTTGNAGSHSHQESYLSSFETIGWQNAEFNFSGASVPVNGTSDRRMTGEGGAANVRAYLRMTNSLRNTNSTGDHNHSFNTNTTGSHTHSVDIPATTSTTNGAHTHTVTVSSGGSATPVNIAPRSMSVNMFVYLGF